MRRGSEKKGTAVRKETARSLEENGKVRDWAYAEKGYREEKSRRNKPERRMPSPKRSSGGRKALLPARKEGLRGGKSFYLKGSRVIRGEVKALPLEGGA